MINAPVLTRLAGYAVLAALLGLAGYRLAGALGSPLLGILAVSILYLAAISLWCSIRNRDGASLG